MSASRASWEAQTRPRTSNTGAVPKLGVLSGGAQIPPIDHISHGFWTAKCRLPHAGAMLWSAVTFVELGSVCLLAVCLWADY